VEVKVYEFESGVRRAARSGAGAVVLVDALRASATVCALVSRGARVRPFTKVEEAVAKRSEGWIVAAEVGAERAPGADIDNSPTAALAMPEERLRGRDVALATTNGTRLMSAAIAAGADGGPMAFVGSFVNATVLTEKLKGMAPAGVALVAAGRNDERAIEDYVCVQYLNALLAGERDAAGFLHANFYDAMLNAYPDIEARGLLPDVKLCLEPDSIPVVPMLKDGAFSSHP
jgi:2-phosphosulfolactate phosphatase